MIPIAVRDTIPGINQELTDYNDGVKYTQPLYFGTPIQNLGAPGAFVADTSVNYVATSSTRCTNCQTNYYNYADSSTYGLFGTDTNVDFGYKTGSSLTGYITSDQVCVSESVCLQDFVFLEVSSIDDQFTEYSEFDGILGFAPRY